MAHTGKNRVGQLDELQLKVYLELLGLIMEALNKLTNSGTRDANSRGARSAWSLGMLMSFVKGSSKMDC